MLRVQLNDIQRDEMRLLARRMIGRVSERIHFVLLADAGTSPPEIGQLLGYDPATVRLWLKRFLTHGVAGLDDEPRSGRPCTQPHLADIVETQAGQAPTVYGYMQTMWTMALLVMHLGERFRVWVSASSVRRALHGLGFTWHRPKLWPARRPDPDRALKEARLAEVLANSDPEAAIVAVDECECHLLAVLRAMWQRRGQQVRLPTPGFNRRRSVFGALNLRTGAWHYTLTDHKRSADFIAFLTILLTLYATGTLYVIADNASIHHSQTTLAWLAQHPRLQLVYLPTYSGHRLNPVEKVWWQLKRTIAANRNFRTLPELDVVIQRCLDAFEPAALLRLCNCDVIRRAGQALPPNVQVSFEH